MHVSRARCIDEGDAEAEPQARRAKPRATLRLLTAGKSTIADLGNPVLAEIRSTALARTRPPAPLLCVCLFRTRAGPEMNMIGWEVPGFFFGPTTVFILILHKFFDRTLKIFLKFFFSNNTQGVPL